MYKGEVTKIEPPSYGSGYNIVYLQYRDEEAPKAHIFSDMELESAQKEADCLAEIVNKNPSTEGVKNIIILVMMLASFLAGILAHPIFVGK